MNDAAVRIYVLNIGFVSKFLSFPGKESFFEMPSPATDTIFNKIYKNSCSI